jgi:HD-GYP domain-containing protein (c-di-GMP phosphodiesterase class II)
VLLQAEFGVPFAFYDAASGLRIPEPACEISPLPADEIMALAQEGRARVTPLTNTTYQLGLVLHAGLKPVFVAVATFPSLAADADGLNSLRRPAAQLSLVAAREQVMLAGWLQAVSDRLRLEDQIRTRGRAEEAHHSKATLAWEALLTVDQLARCLRFHRDPAKNQQLILANAGKLLPAEFLCWIPLNRDQPVLTQGEGCLDAEEARQLAQALLDSPDAQSGSPLFCNEVRDLAWGPRFPKISNLIASLVTDQGPLGWFVAANRKEGTAFRRSDAALLLPFAALLELHLRWRQRFQDLKDLLVGLTRSLTTALDAKDTYTYGHSERVARIAVELGRELGLTGEDLGDLYLAGLLHDVGKIGIRDTVLHKPGPLTAEEQEHIQQHVTIGYWILAELKPIRNLLPGVLYHHERVDGQGYPDGLVGEGIPLLARILAVADAYDAMSHPRPYRDSLPYRQVEEILAKGAGVHWDRQVVEAFQRCRQHIHIIRQRGVGDSLRQAIDGALRSEMGAPRSKSALLRAEEPRPRSATLMSAEANDGVSD